MKRLSTALTVLFAAVAFGGCGGDPTPSSLINDQCDADYPNSPTAKDNCVQEKEAQFLACRDDEKARGVTFADTNCI
jgi:hypothetical protein